MIKNVFLDLGVVTVSLDRQRCVSAFAALGIGDIDRQISNFKQFGLFGAIETGKISIADFHNRVRSLYHLTITDAQIDAAWNAFILDTPSCLQALIRQLRPKYKFYILSNTNQIHYDYWAQHCMGEGKGFTVADYFDICYLSNELHLAKPDAAIYQAVLADSGALASESLYLDDNSDNVAAGKAMGFQAEQSLSTTQTYQRLQQLL